jgi:hypothetical protein
MVSHSRGFFKLNDRLPENPHGKSGMENPQEMMKHGGF